MQSLPDPLIYEILCYLKADELWRMRNLEWVRGQIIVGEAGDRFSFGDLLFRHESDWYFQGWMCLSKSSRIQVWKSFWHKRLYNVAGLSIDSQGSGQYPDRWSHYTPEEKQEIERLIRYL